MNINILSENIKKYLNEKVDLKIIINKEKDIKEAIQSTDHNLTVIYILGIYDFYKLKKLTDKPNILFFIHKQDGFESWERFVNKYINKTERQVYVYRIGKN